MLLVVKSRPVKVPPHQREHHPVRGYVRAGRDRMSRRQPYTDEARARMTAAYPAIERLAIGTVVGVMAKGQQIQFPDEAVMNGIETGLHAVARQIDPLRFRRRIKNAVKQYMDWEKTHGVTGTGLLLRQFYGQAPAERQAMLHLLPKAEPLETIADLTTASPEEATLAEANVRSREAALAEVEQRYQINLDRVRAMLQKRRSGVRGRLAATIEQDIKIFEDRLRGYSFREIGHTHGVSHTYARSAYERLLGKMREVAHAESAEGRAEGSIQAWERGKVAKALRIGDVAQDRLLQAFARHYRAIQDGLPIEFVDNSRYLLTNALLEEEVA